jgi:WD40 repeat protein
MLRLWNATSGHEDLSIGTGIGPVLRLAFSPDGTRIHSKHNNTLASFAWDTTTGQRLSQGSQGWNFNWTTGLSNKLEYASAVSPDQDRDFVRANSDHTLTLSNGKKTHNTCRELHKDKSCATDVDVSADGRQICAFCLDDQIRIWDVSSGQEIRTLVPPRDTKKPFWQRVAFEPDGKRIVSGGSDGKIRIWDVMDGHELFTLTGHSGPINQLWFCHKGGMTWFSGHSGQINQLEFCRDGSWFSSASVDNTLNLWDANNGRLRHTIPDAGTIMAISRDGKHIVSARHLRQLHSVSNLRTVVSLWSTANREAKYTIEDGVGVTCLTISPDARWTVGGREDGSVKVWEVANGRDVHTLNGHRGCVTSVAFSPDGKRIVSGGTDRTLRLWAASSGQQTLLLRVPGQIASVKFSPTGKWIVSVSNDERGIRIWDTTTAEEHEAFHGPLPHSQNPPLTR